MAGLDKRYAWRAAQHYARELPWCCHDLPQRLTEHMHAKAKEAPQEIPTAPGPK